MASVSFTIDDYDIDVIYRTMEILLLRLNNQLTREVNLYRNQYEQTGGEGFDHTPFEWAIGGVNETGDLYGIIIEGLEQSGYEEAEPVTDYFDLWSL